MASKAGGNVAEVEVASLQATLQQAGVRLFRPAGAAEKVDADTPLGEVASR
jgi:hypothetical protein